MQLRTIGLVMACALGACGGGAPPASTTAAVPPTQPASGAAVEFGEITVYEKDTATLKFHADGTTEMGTRSGRLEIKPGSTASTDSLPLTWKPGPTIKPDGTFSLDGTDLARIGADGTIVVLKTNQKMPLTITDDKMVVDVEPGKTITIQIGAGGRLLLTATGRAGTEDEGRVEGADTAGKRRLVFGYLALMLLGKGKAVVVDHPSNASAPAVPGP